jgi:uncharacterized protein YjiS (DUF1127 family)
MVAIDASRAIYVSVDFFGRFGASLAALFGTVAAWNDARVTRNALAGLSDRELEDIGLCRGDIDTVAASLRV